MNLRTSGNDMENVDKVVELASAAGKPYVEIDFRALEKGGLINPGAPRSLVAEEFRQIKRPLLNNAFGASANMVDKGNLVLVTSTFPNEGKSFTAINLALSCAMELDKTVLLIDADLVNPSLFNVLNLPPTKGLSDYLSGKFWDVAPLLQRTNLNNLVLLSAGRMYEHSAELLSSEKMKKLLDEIESRYDDRIVIIDSPPLLVSNEARILAELVGQIVMVVESGKTAEKDLKMALEFLDHNKSIGLVLNKCQSHHQSFYYPYPKK